MQIVELNEPLNSLQKRLCRCDVEPKNTLYNLNIQYFIILQSKLKENILGRCLSTGATKFSKIVLADKKKQNGYIRCSTVCPFKSVKNIFFVKLFDF